ncbi:3-dehydroquinate synthase [Caulobacter sp. S45]|uniref:3-dehydroquinate synthase n=1 Tax=Caulobacter sp. S45 TaxID=1641861 RepID=UPI0015770307|nr:3-dehydroquinate synthase [Caulobacter sp. S45]
MNAEAGRRVQVDLGGRAYEVHIGTRLIDQAGELLAPHLPRRRTVVVTDRHVADHHGERLAAALEAGGIAVDMVVLPPGEQTKSFAGLEDLIARLLVLKLDRGDRIVAFGGGVVGDLAGFAAAIYKRGIDFIQVPTTLLAQVDSSVGGKTAIDTAAGKNLVGAFHQPCFVLADLDVLATLPERELRAGYGEVLKYGLLGDAAFFGWLEANGGAVLAGEAGPLAHAVARCVEMKAQIVAEDERETGRRALLNLGHTFAHALESETGFGEALLHGEAVAAGCALAFRFSAELGVCPPEAAARAEAAIAGAGLPTRLRALAGAPFDASRLVDHMAQDKKAEAGGLVFVLARGIGEAFIAKGVDRAALLRFLAAEGARLGPAG